MPLHPACRSIAHPVRRGLAAGVWLALLLATPTRATPLFDAPSLVFETGENPLALAIADLNRDGRADIVTANSGGYGAFQGSISILLGVGDGTFAPRTDIVCGADPRELAIADFNRDDAPDLVVTHRGFAPDYPGMVTVLPGRSDGTFGPANDLVVGYNASALVIADLDGDQNLDLAMAGVGRLSVLHGHGDGTFGPLAEFPTIFAPSGMATGDLNGDGFLDLALAVSGADDSDETSYAIALMFGNGEESFTFRTGVGRATYPTSVAIADLNEDGRLDLAMASVGDGCCYSALTVLRGNGDGTFTAQIGYPVGQTPLAVAIADLNGDGRVDLATANYGDDPDFDSNSISVLTGNGDGTFARMADLPVGENPCSVAIADLDGDGDLDLATANSSWSNTVSVLLGNGNATFGVAPVPAGFGTRALAIADFDQDGRPDLVAANATPYPAMLGSVTVFRGGGDGAFTAGATRAIGVSPRFLAVGDLNADNSPDLVTLSSSSSLLLGNGDSTFGPEIGFDAAGANSATIGDVNGDGRGDLLLTNPGAYPEWNGRVEVMLGNGDGTFTPSIAFAAGIYPTWVMIADLDRDGRVDLIANGYQGVSVLLGHGDGTFGPVTHFGASAVTRPAIADVNADGRPDLVVDAGGPGVSVLLGNGDGTFQPGREFPAGPDALWPVVADYTGDGRADVAVVNETTAGTVSVLPGNGDGTFGARVVFGVGGWPAALHGADLNLDGRPDLVTLSGGSVSILLANAAFSVLSVDVTFERVVLRWQGRGAADLVATVHRRDPASTWESIGTAVAEGGDVLRFEDRRVMPRERYGYRLGYRVGATEYFSPEHWVDVPVRVRPSLHGFRPNPSIGPPTIAFTLVDDSPATLDVMDIAGRRVIRRELRGLGAGPHSLALPGTALVPGVYMLRLQQSGLTVRARGVVVY